MKGRAKELKGMEKIKQKWINFKIDFVLWIAYKLGVGVDLTREYLDSIMN